MKLPFGTYLGIWIAALGFFACLHSILTAGNPVIASGNGAVAFAITLTLLLEKKH